MRITVLLLLVLVIACAQTNGKRQCRSAKSKAQPEYEVALRFISDYARYSNDMDSETRLIDWIGSRKDITDSFKSELRRILDEAEKESPETGLGFDPVVDAQDFPSSFEIAQTDGMYVVVKGIEWPEFKLTISVRSVGGKWCVDGAGIVNIPENKRIQLLLMVLKSDPFIS